MDGRKNDQLIIDKINQMNEGSEKRASDIIELEKRRNKNLERVKMEILEKTEASIRDALNEFHVRPSKETLKLVNDVKTCLGNHIDNQFIYETSTKEILDSQNLALKEIKETLATMAPSYKMLNNVAITGEVLTRVGKFLLTTVIIFSTVIGAIYAFREWIRK